MTHLENNNEPNDTSVIVKIFYSGKEEQIEISKDKTIEELKICIISLLNINFTNYDLVYKLQTFDEIDNTIVLEQILKDDINPSFILRKKGKEIAIISYRNA